MSKSKGRKPTTKSKKRRAGRVQKAALAVPPVRGGGGPELPTAGTLSPERRLLDLLGGSTPSPASVRDVTGVAGPEALRHAIGRNEFLSQKIAAAVCLASANPGAAHSARANGTRVVQPEAAAPTMPRSPAAVPPITQEAGEASARPAARCAPRPASPATLRERLAAVTPQAGAAIEISSSADAPPNSAAANAPPQAAEAPSPVAARGAAARRGASSSGEAREAAASPPEDLGAVIPGELPSSESRAESRGGGSRPRPDGEAAPDRKTGPNNGAVLEHAPDVSAAARAARTPRARDDEKPTPLTPQLHARQRSSDDFRDVLTRGLAGCKRNFVTVGIFSFVVNVLLLALPIYLFQVSDRVLTSRSTDTLLMLTIVVVGAVAMQSLLDMMRRFLLMRIAVQVETTLGAPVLSAATKAAQNGSTREFQALLDLQQLRNFVTGPVILSMFDAPVAPIYFLAVYLIHPWLGLVLTVSALVLVAVALVNQRITAVPFANASAYSMRANAQAEAMARNAQIINAMGMIREGVLLWGRETAQSITSQMKAQDLNVMMATLSRFMRLSTQVAMLGVGAYLALESELTGGMMIAASIIGSRALQPVEGLIEGWRSFVQARGGFARIRALLNSSPLNVERLQLPRPQGRLMVDRVLFVPPPTKKVVLNGINFTLEPGESLAIVGPSGTGKSTLARMLVGSIAPTSGAVRLDFMDIRNWDPRQFGECVGYLPQDVQLFPASIKSNIARMREDVSDEAIFDAADMAGIHQLISQMPQGYETQIGIDGAPLSGGQRQRIALARAFFGLPRLVVLDEPNSNLDTAGEQALAQSLLRAKERQITVVTVTQRPSLLKSVDKIMLMNEGTVQALGRRDEIIPKLMAPKGAVVDVAV